MTTDAARTFQRKTALLRLSRLEALITAAPMTVTQIAEALHCCRNTAWVYVRAAKDSVHVVRWEQRDTGPPAPVYAWGKRKSVPRPPKLTAAQSQARLRARYRAEGLDVEQAIKGRARAFARRLKPRRSSMDVALYGAAA